MRLKTTPWIGFDLDGTLHDMAAAHGGAMEKLYPLIAAHHPTHPVASNPACLDALYWRTNRRRLNPDTFASGAGADELRAQRFAAMLAEAGIVDHELVGVCVERFRAFFTAILRPFPEARPLFERLKANGYRIAIVSEGARDGPSVVLRHLSLDLLVDLVVSAGNERLTKPRGLFRRALERMGCDGEGVPFVGDSLGRDILPAAEAGMAPIWFSPDEDERDAGVDHLPEGAAVIGNLREVADVLGL